MDTHTHTHMAVGGLRNQKSPRTLLEAGTSSCGDVAVVWVVSLYFIKRANCDWLVSETIRVGCDCSLLVLLLSAGTCSLYDNSLWKSRQSAV
jgi:hypothetical protein